MIRVDYQNHRPTVSLAGELTDAPALEFVDEIRRLSAMHFYTEFLLGIASPGGLGSALRHCVRGFDDLRASGLRIATRVRSEAGSAAAVLVSLGDCRLTAFGTRLQYHHVPVVGVDVVTGALASRLARGLSEINSGITALLVERARRDCGSEDHGGPARVRDFEPSDWEVLRRLVRRAGKKGKGDASPRLLKRLRRKVAEAVADARPGKLARLYEALFDFACSIPPRPNGAAGRPAYRVRPHSQTEKGNER